MYPQSLRRIVARALLAAIVVAAAASSPIATKAPSRVEALLRPPVMPGGVYGRGVSRPHVIPGAPLARSCRFGRVCHRGRTPARSGEVIARVLF
jgi:hypothetical protein